MITANRNRPEVTRVHTPRRLQSILLVDDYAPNTAVLGEALTCSGYQIVATDNGAGALASLARQHFDLVLMDINMPGMDGLTATRRIRSSHTDYAAIPIIAVSAHSLPVDIFEIMAAGMNDYAVKPVQLDDLLFRITALIGQSSSC